MTIPISFGRQLLASSAPSEALAIELTETPPGIPSALDALVSRIAGRSIAGERVATLTVTKGRGARLTLDGLVPEDRALIEELLSPQALRKRGLWTLPERASLRVGLMSLPHAWRTSGRYGPQLAAEEAGPVPLVTSEAIFAWAVLCPLFEAIYQPVILRTMRAGEGSAIAQKSLWEGVESLLHDLQLDLGDDLAQIRYGGGWSRLRAPERTAAVGAFLGRMTRKTPTHVGALYRCRRTRLLVERYYAKAKGPGIVRKEQVLTAAHTSTLVGFWGGDWPAFVGYLGEQLHPDEQIITSLPDSTPKTTSAARIAAVAAAQGLPPEAVAAVAAAVFGEDPGERRLACMRAFWGRFDELHARQRSGMRPLWGLVPEDGPAVPDTNGGPYQAQLFREVLPAELNDSVRELWGAKVWSRFPGRLTTEWAPHRRMADAFGPALKFWEGVALTSWFVCEGPYSRTDIAGIEAYHERELAALEDADAPVDPTLFRDLRAAERGLGDPETVVEQQNAVDVGGLTLTFSLGRGTRRTGFEQLRDVVTFHRRAWADQHLENYLRRRWESVSAGASERYHALVNARAGKPPTLRQTTKAVCTFVNEWLGGDFSAFYRLVREPAPSPAEDTRVVIDAYGDAGRLFEAFRDRVQLSDATQANAAYYARSLTRHATNYIRWLEATGTPATPERLESFSYDGVHLHRSEAEAWALFEQIIEDACLRPAPWPVAVKSPGATGFGSPVAPGESIHAERPVQTLKVSSAGRVEARPWWKRLFGSG